MPPPHPSPPEPQHPPHPLYTSQYSLPYPPHSAQNTLDIHLPTNPPLSPSYWIVYIHGGAFRDPLVLSPSILPSLPTIFAPGHHIKGVASVNYRLAAYPEHPTNPSHGGKERKGGEGNREGEGRDSTWPDMIEDVRGAVGWLLGLGGEGEEGGEGTEGNGVKGNARGGEGGIKEGRGAMAGQEFIVVGHSVGGTMGVMLGLSPSPSSSSTTLQPPSSANPYIGQWGHHQDFPGLKAIVSIAGIFDFAALRDAHLPMRGLYDSFITAAYGEEESGAWEAGNVIAAVDGHGSDGARRRLADGLEVVLIAGSRGDELVEWAQGEALVGALKEVESEEKRVVELVEVWGKHQELVSEGKVVGDVAARAINLLDERHDGR